MQIKHCTECGNQNLVTAKYCYSCGFCFLELAALNPTPSTPAKPTIKPLTKLTLKPVEKKSKQSYVFDTDATENLSPEDTDDVNGENLEEFDEEFNNSFANLVVGKEKKSKGMKFEEVVGKSEGEDRRALGKRKSTSPKNAKAILKTGESKNKRRTQE